MKSQKLSLTQTNSQAPQPLDYIELGLSYSFVFETLNQDLGLGHKVIKGSNPIQVFRSLKALDLFLEKNPDLLELENAGFAGYIGYEGNCELAVYEKIEVTGDSCQVTGDKSIIASDFKIIKPDPELYIQAVKKCQEYIKEGDIYQANIAHKFQVLGSKLKAQGVGKKIYENLKSLNPAPYTGYMNFQDYEIISSSPESFIKIARGSGLKAQGPWIISSSPIKGTAKLNELNELLESNKERAEHIMIVDLIRNDLGKICAPGSIKLKELMGIHQFKNLYHYVSTVEGQLCHSECNEESNTGSVSSRNDIPNFSKIFKATFPGGSITGTPKKKAVEIIKELESSPRELFTGSMGYFKFQDDGEFNILIRSIIHNKKTGKWSFHTGSGITAYSNPQKELEESYLKAEKLAEVFGVKL